MRKLFVAVFLFSIIFISGCTTPGGFGEKYCSAIGICDVKEKEVEIPDIVVIKKIDIPLVRDGRIGPNRDVDIFVTLENKDVNKIITLTYVGINPGIFTCKEPENCEYSGETIGPGQDRVFSFKVTSPNNPGTIAIPGHLEFSVKYKYTSTRLATMTYITENTYIQYAKSGKEIPVQIINVPSDGPVELYLDISKIKQPVIVGDEGAKLSGMFAKPKITGGIIFAAKICPYLSCEQANEPNCLCGEALTTSQHPWCCAAGNKGWGYLASDKKSCQQAPECAAKICPYLSCEQANEPNCLCGEALTTSQHPWCCAAGNNGWGYLASDKKSCQQAPECAAKTSESSEPEKTKQEEGKYQIYLEVMNKGSGEIDKIAPGNLNIYFEDMEVKSCSEEFKIINKNKVENIKPIIIRGQKPFKYYFSFDPSSSIKSELTKNENILTITKRITANADY
ncbi:MAG: hypothetical protein DRP14_03565, partial [Candidatus Aenigmatarchaeota archaeon]